MKCFLKYPLVCWFECIEFCIFALPRFRCCNFLKKLFILAQGGKVGRGVIFYSGVRIGPARKLQIGSGVDVAAGVQLIVGGGITIGSRTWIGYRTMIIGSNHTIPPGRERMFLDAAVSALPDTDKAVKIGNDVWLGANCIVLPGVNIGEGSVVGAGSVVTRDIPPFTIAVGSPARVVRERN